MTSSRAILHADMDAFYAAIEQRDDPALRGRAVIVGGLGRRGVVATASYEARRFGVHSAMPTAVARRRCPDGVYLLPRMEVYAAVSAQVRDVFASFTPLVEALSLDEAFLDVTASRALFGSAEEIARQLKRKVAAATGLTVSVGVATSKFVAKVASDFGKPDGLVVVPPGDEMAFLAPLPVRRLWGAGPATQRRLAAVGVQRIGDVQALPRERLANAFGASWGEHFWRLAHGLDERAVEPERDPKSISHEVTFEHDRAPRDELHRVLLELSEGVGRRLRQQRTAGRIVRIKVRFPPFETHTRQARLASAVQDDLLIHRRAVELFDRLVPRERPVRLLGVGVAALVAEGAPQQNELFAAPDRARRVLAAMDAIRDRFGEDAIRHGR